MKGVFERKDLFGLKATRISHLQRYSPMFHPHGELVYVAKGKFCVTVDGKELFLKEGDVMVIFPYLVHSYEASRDTDVILVLFDPAETSFDNTFWIKKPLSPITDGKSLAPLLERILFHSRNGKAKTAMGYLNAVLGEYLEMVPTVKSDRRSDQGAIRVLSYLAEHYAEEVTVSSVAKALYVSSSYVSKIFSQQLQYGFREYLNILRIQKAISLLESSNKKIVEIMLDSGFQNQSSFNRVFRELTGTSPADYRASLKRGEREN